MKIFVRFGEAADYQSADSIAEIAEMMQEIGISSPYHPVHYGITAPGYTGQNYISLFWGKDVETPYRSLNEHEIDFLNSKDEDSIDIEEPYIGYVDTDSI